MSEENKTLVLPESMTKDIEQALGLMCFSCARYAHAFKKGGENIAPKAEAEQAAIIFKVLKKIEAGMDFERAFAAMHNDAVDTLKRVDTRAGEKA